MEDNTQKNKPKYPGVISRIFSLLFIALGILNLIFVHVIPGCFYLVLSLMYLPATTIFIKKRLGFRIPFAVTVIAGLVVLWATLAVGDLMEMFESWMLN